MLAQNFKSATDLGIADVEFEALVKLLGMLERGEFVHGKWPLSGSFQRAPNEFNMATLLEEADCGTIGCLCGWAYVISHRRAFAEIINKTASNELSVIGDLPANLQRLFGFGAHWGALRLRTPAQTAIALRNYLTTGEPNWAEAMALGRMQSSAMQAGEP